MSRSAEEDLLTSLAAGSMQAGVADHAVRCRVEALRLLAASQQSGSPCAGLLHDWWWLQSGAFRSVPRGINGARSGTGGAWWWGDGHAAEQFGR